MQLKIQAAGKKTSDKIYLKAMADFFQNMICDQGRNDVKHEGKRKQSWWEVTSNVKGRHKILSMQGETPSSSLSGKS